jgi:peptidyl-prolyl cis-trans isomerase B (cyclophilin B)
MKRRVILVIAIIVFAQILVGCGGSPQAGKPAPPSETPTTGPASSGPQLQPGSTPPPETGLQPPKAGVPGSPSEIPAKTSPFEVSLIPAEDYCRIDYPVEVTVILRNRSSETVKFDKGISFIRSFVINNSAKGVTEPLAEDTAFTETLAIPPGGFIGLRCDLATFFQDFKKAGEYQVSWADPYIGESRSVIMVVTPYALVMTDFGDFNIRLAPGEVAPRTVAQFRRLARQGFYDGASVSGIRADRVVAFSPSQANLDEFAGEYAPLKPESPTEVISPGDVVTFGGAPSFFVQLAPGETLGVKYTVFGRIFGDGTKVLESISRTRQARGSQGQTLARPADQIRINRLIIVDKPSALNRRPNLAPEGAIPRVDLTLSSKTTAFTFGEPINVELKLANPYSSALKLPTAGLKGGLKIIRLVEEGPQGQRVAAELNADFPEMFLPVSRGILPGGGQVGITLDITDLCPAFQNGGTFEITWEAGAIKTKPIVITIQKSLFATIVTTKGTFQAILFPETAPQAVERFRMLAVSGFYNEMKFFHARNAPALALVQTGSKIGDTTGKAPDLKNLPLEPIDRLLRVGTIALAHTETDPDSGNSQFFMVTRIRADAAKALSRHYSVIGEIIAGRDAKGNPTDYQSLLAQLRPEDKIIRIEITQKKPR